MCGTSALKWFQGQDIFFLNTFHALKKKKLQEIYCPTKYIPDSSPNQALCLSAAPLSSLPTGHRGSCQSNPVKSERRAGLHRTVFVYGCTQPSSGVRLHKCPHSSRLTVVCLHCTLCQGSHLIMNGLSWPVLQYTVYVTKCGALYMYGSRCGIEKG